MIDKNKEIEALIESLIALSEHKHDDHSVAAEAIDVIHTLYEKLKKRSTVLSVLDYDDDECEEMAQQVFNILSKNQDLIATGNDK